MLGMTELGGDTGSTAATPQMRTVMRFVSVISVPMTYWFPSAIFCYWIPNNMVSMTLGAVMRQPATRKALGFSFDPAKIPGTRANRALMSKMAASANIQVDPAKAAASYLSKSSSLSTRTPANASDIVKPVLLKTRPSKKGKSKASQSSS